MPLMADPARAADVELKLQGHLVIAMQPRSGFYLQSQVLILGGWIRGSAREKKRKRKHGKVLSVTVTEFEDSFATTVSSVPSPFRSAATTATGALPVGKDTGIENVPSPLPTRIFRLFPVWSATARS